VRFWVQTFGCQMNEHDSERLAGLLLAEGMEPAGGVDEADVVLVNTCCIREHADERLYGFLGRLKPLKARRPELRIAVGGCLAQKDRERVLARAGHVDVVFGTANLTSAPELLRRSKRLGRAVVEVPGVAGSVAERVATPGAGEAVGPVAARAQRHRAWVTIQQGCDNSCTFCIVPAVRGPEVSRRMGEIVDEVAALAADGVREITLLGQNVNSYGRDLGAGRFRPRFADLLRALDGVEGIERIRFTSPHPKDLRPETIAAMAECRAVCPHLHLPLQSGSDRILARMHRGYTAGRYLARVAAARDAVADLAVTTDIIVGFPGETDEDFEATLAVVDAARFDAAYTFLFSPRPGTAAAEMTDAFVPETVARSRFERLVALVNEHAWARNRERVGRCEPVMVDGPSKRDPTRWSGRSPQGKLVHFPPGPVPPTPGEVVPVRIERAAPHWLAGRIAA
jgi:tRNA-2-methylthio-N6-dimethylallyladenosine synthase